MVATPTRQTGNTSTSTAAAIAQAPVPQEDQDRKNAMREAWKSYEGKMEPPLKVATGQPDDNVMSNRCAPIVDKGVSFLFGQVLMLECSDQDYADGLWGDDDERMTLLSKAAINGGAFGEVFLKLIPAQGSMKYPRIVNLDPRNLRIVTDPEDCDLHTAYIIEYPGADDTQKRQVIARIDSDGLSKITGNMSLDDTWSITNYERRGPTGAWYPVGDPETWPYPFAPIICSQNLPNPNEAWGKPDLTSDLIQMNQVLNFVQSNLSRIIKFHGHPKTWAKGVNASQIEIGVDDLIVLNSMEAQIGNLLPMENFDGIMHFAAVIRDDMDEQSRVPSVALGRLEALPKGNISGVALQLLFQPLLEKTTQKRRLYGDLVRAVTRACLVLSNKLAIENMQDYEVNLNWPSMLPNDDLQAAQVALIYQQIGVSTDTIMQSLGFDPDDEAQKSADEDQKKMELYAKGMGTPPPGMAMQPGQQLPGQTTPGAPPPAATAPPSGGGSN